MKKLLFTLSLSMIFTVACAQTSENNKRLKKALRRYPDADKDKDGILTMKEALIYRKTVLAKKQKGSKPAQAPEGGEKMIYKKAGDVELPLYVFNPKDHKAEKQVPGIVFFFGGGWTSGSPKQFESQCKYLADRGMVAVTVEYRVSSRHGAKIEDCIEDAKSAMRWVRSNAAKLGIDPDRIASGGGSAGGHLAACTALIQEFNAESDDLKVSAKPNAMALFNPFMGLSKDQENTKKPTDRTRGPIEKCLPLTYADSKQPPCIMFFGTEDRLLKGAEVFKNSSVKVGNDCKIITYEGQGHSFFNRGKYLDLTAAEMDKFFVKLGWLKAKAK